MAKKRAKRALDTYKLPTLHKVVKPGDCVMLRPPEPKTPQYIARIERIEADSNDRITLRCRWYYRPEESIGGRRQFHGAKELFLSDHFDSCSPDAVESKCTVHTFKEYTRLANVKTEDFFCRFEYKASSGTFTPDRVAVYCKCEMPYNPDDLMILCEQCKDWFHPACVDLEIEQIRKLPNFFCSDCAPPFTSVSTDGATDGEVIP